MLKPGALILMIFSFFHISQASHNLAGQFTYEKTGTNTYEITLTTYTEPKNQWVDRCYVDFEIWSLSGVLLGEIKEIPRSNGPTQDQNYPVQLPPCQPPAVMGIYIFPDIKMSIYKHTHTFTGPGSFVISFRDPARIAGVENMDNSGGTAFYVSTLIRNTPQLGSNNSPYFLNHPIDWACVDKVWTHNPGGTDPEGDSLSYRLIANLKDINTPVVNYQYPNQIPAGGSNTFTIDAATGIITWKYPKVIGVYNIAFVVDEFRNGIKIGEAVRDMAVFVDPCQNDPPVILTITDTCVKAGDTLLIDVISYDPNAGDSLYFQLNNGGGGNNGPFQTNLTPPAVFTFSPPSSIPVETTDTVKGTITWATNCTHIRKSFYQVDLFAHDNFSFYQAGGNTMLSAHHAIKIYVTPPALTGLTLTPGPRQVTLNWNQYNCAGAIGYHVYRSLNGPGSQLDSVCCGDDPAGNGFELIYSTTSMGIATYLDDLSEMTEFVSEICYVVVAYFAENQLSCPSNTECIQILTGEIVMTNDSVNVTSATAGENFVSWAKPDTTGINTIFFPPPYFYKLYRAGGITGTKFYQVSTPVLSLEDTTFMDIPLNTVDRGHKYRVDLFDQAGKIATSNKPSSVFLTTISGDKEITLEWSEYVPWNNSEYVVFRSDSFTGNFVVLDTVAGTGANTHSYLDTGLVNDEDYCYYILSLGGYSGITGVKSPLLNASQKTCDVPRDRTPPCFAETDVDTAYSCEEFYVHFFFDELDSLCAGDLNFFRIYFADAPGGSRTLVATLPAGDSIYFFDDLGSVSDCYYIAAVDTNGNESALAEYCFDNCPEFVASNIFTPNGDNINDWFDPFRHRSVVINKVLIFDRWGHQIFTADREINDIDPNRLWSGTMDNGSAASEGVYFFVIEYDEDRLNGLVRQPPMRNHLTLLR